MALNWYALRTKPRKERFVCNQLREHQVEVFFPQLRVQPVNPRASKYKPYFPGYLFIHIETEQVNQSLIQWMPYSVGLVSYGDEPAVIADHLIAAIDKRTTEISKAGGEVFTGLKPGDSIMIDYGPFEGYEGLFDVRLPGTERVRILLKFLNSRRVPVEIPAAYISKKKKI
jgi:transcriptional antiterminator RfaH